MIQRPVQADGVTQARGAPRTSLAEAGNTFNELLIPKNLAEHRHEDSLDRLQHFNPPTAHTSRPFSQNPITHTCSNSAETTHSGDSRRETNMEEEQSSICYSKVFYRKNKVAEIPVKNTRRQYNYCLYCERPQDLATPFDSQRRTNQV